MAVCPVERSSNSIVSGVPLCQLFDRYFDHLVTLRSVFQRQNLLPDAVPSQLGEEPDPGVVVDAATEQTFSGPCQPFVCQSSEESNGGELTSQSP